MRRTLIASAACLAAGLLIGRWTAPARREKVIVDREVYAGTWARGVAYVQTSAVKNSTRTVTRWTPTPAGTVVEKVETTAAQEETHAERVASEARHDVVARESRVETRSAPDRRWTATAMVGWSAQRNQVWGAAVAYRVVGPLAVGAWAMSDRAVGGQLSVTW